MGKTLYIFVENFSNKHRESFFEKELPYLSEKFRKIYVIPLYPDDSQLNFTSNNIEVLHFNFFLPCNRIKILFSNFFSILKIYTLEIYKTHNKYFYFKNFKSNLNDLLYKISAAKNLEKLIKKDINANTIFYSYWFMQWVMTLSIIKIKKPCINIVSRVHGADYDELQIKRTLPFRYFQLSKVNKIFPVSNYAKNYLQSVFKVNQNKIIVSHLGLLLNENLSPIAPSELLLVSCSSMIPLKRVELIIDILKNLSGTVKWTHFGDGPLYNNIKEKAKLLNKNIEIDFKGYVSNSDFLNYLRNNSISIFINVSESEGIPVTMMEALAFGIPLIGTDVCGVPEIVCDKTGFLIPKNFNSQNVAAIINEAHLKKNIYLTEYRIQVQNYYKKYFYAPVNHKTFAALLSS